VQTVLVTFLFAEALPKRSHRSCRTPNHDIHCSPQRHA